MSVKKEDLREYSDEELSRRVFGDEFLYCVRYNMKQLNAVLDEIFVYSDEQYNELVKDIEAEEA